MKRIIIISLTVFCLAFIISFGNKSSNNKVITINAGPQPKTIDPSLNTALDGCYYVIHAFEGLTTKDKDGNIVGGVA